MSHNVKLALLIRFISNFIKLIRYLINAPINIIMRLANDIQIDLFHFNSIESFYNYITTITTRYFE